MKSPNPEITKDLVLVGGGHSHAIALKKWGMNPIPGVRLTLVTDVYHTPYSGMLPGYVAGLYTFDQCHIDLRPLSQFAQARLVCDRAVHLDLTHNQLHCAHHPPIGFDILSLDIGSTPSTVTVPGAQEYAIPVKPISKYLDYWEQVVADVTQAPQRPFWLGVVGGGAGGVELALSAQGRLQRLYRQTAQPDGHLEIHLFQRGPELLPERHPGLRDRMRRLMVGRGIHLHLGETVTAIEPGARGAQSDPQKSAVEKFDGQAYRVRCESGLTVGCDRVFWVTQAAAASWLAQSGLDTDERGFVAVNDCLQSTSHPQVFAAGDVATMVNHPRPKAGVFAVRQGEPLYRNLRRAVLDQPLQPFHPQKKFLILIGTGNETAIASRGAFNLGPLSLLWKWKDRIDRQFMDRFTHLDQAMGSSPTSHPSLSPPPAMPCSGCGSKVGSSVLETVLTRIRADFPAGGDRPDILIGLGEADDAAVIQVAHQRHWVQTVDYFRTLLDDPFLAGQITANHCLSDLFAMGADPHSVMAIATLPYATPAKQEEMLYHLLSGVVKVAQPAQAPLIGGHTVAGDALALGLVCNGTVVPGQILRKGGMNPGDRLILTKALGTGTLFAADMQLRAKGRWIEGAIASMLLSNQGAAHCLREYQATACTDVTGFGLLGHLLEMVRSPHNASPLAVELHLAALPLLEGAKEAIAAGLLSSLHPDNLKAAGAIANYVPMADHPLFPILADPQTAGGLLAAVPAGAASDCLAALHEQGYGDSTIVGTVAAAQAEQPPIVVQ